MPFAPWLTQPETKDEEPYDPNDSSLLVNILKPEPGEKMKDWFLDHLDVTPVEDDPSLLVNILKPEPGEKMKDWFLDHLDVTPVEKPPR